METAEKTILNEYTDQEKGAYLGAIASIATADHVATPEEIEHLEELAEAAGISEDQKSAVVRAATELSEEELRRCLDILKDSELRFSLVADLIQFAESDRNYSENEKKSVENIASYINVNKEQFSLLDQFVKKSAQAEAKPEEVASPGFLSSLGLQDKFQNAGISWKKFLPGLLGVAGPLLLSRMFNRNRSSLSAGGIGSMFNRNAGGGGIGSLISMLSGGRGMGNLGGLLSGLFGRR
jgi:uncharacterized tellurite resistance protein B-like protein